MVTLITCRTCEKAHPKSCEYFEKLKDSDWVCTRDYPENLNGGIMICGLNFGTDPGDDSNTVKRLCEYLSLKKSLDDPENWRTFYPDVVGMSRFDSRIFKWFDLWGHPLEGRKGSEGAFEHAFFHRNWSLTQTKTANLSDDMLVREALEPDGILHVLEKRLPSVIMFFGTRLVGLLNDERIRDRVENILGKRSDKEKIDPVGKYKMQTQVFGKTHIIGLPHPRAAVAYKDIVALKDNAAFQSVLAKILEHKGRSA
ncbi:MAG: hypothetical protein LBQ75_07725 [Zoogloeaceae bacterium]|jgi:hypothetical protein|nr:hypothetical protein [Zoogloeaceae bacterium]